MQRGADQRGTAAWASGPATAEFRASARFSANIRDGLVCGWRPASARYHICHHHLPPRFSRSIFSSRGFAGNASSSSLPRPNHSFRPPHFWTGFASRSLASKHVRRPLQMTQRIMLSRFPGRLQAEDDSGGILCVSTLHWLSKTAVLVGASVMEPSDSVQALTASRQVTQYASNHEGLVRCAQTTLSNGRHCKRCVAAICRKPLGQH